MGFRQLHERVAGAEVIKTVSQLRSFASVAADILKCVRSPAARRELRRRSSASSSVEMRA